MNKTTRETATILAALKCYANILAEVGEPPDNCADVASKSGMFEPLDAEEINKLCADIEFGRDELPLRSALDNAHSALSTAQIQFEQCESMFKDDHDFIEASAIVSEAVEVAAKALDGKEVEIPPKAPETADSVKAFANKEAKKMVKRFGILKARIIARFILKHTASP